MADLKQKVHESTQKAKSSCQTIEKQNDEIERDLGRLLPRIKHVDSQIMSIGESLKRYKHELETVSEATSMMKHEKCDILEMRRHVEACIPDISGIEKEQAQLVKGLNLVENYIEKYEPLKIQR